MEYALLIAGIAILVVVVVYTLGGSVSGQFDDACDQITQQRGGEACD